MPRAVLIGDSIRMGYQEFVRRELDGEVEIVSPDENGGDSRKVLENLNAWAIEPPPDVIHINCGLHDIKKPFGSPEPAVPLSEYGENVRKILSTLKKSVGGALIWASTTPVNEKWHHERKAFDRFETDVPAYNREAEKACQSLGIPINDLYALVSAHGRDQLLSPDGVHYEVAGYRLIGRTVAREIRKALGITAPI